MSCMNGLMLQMGQAKLRGSREERIQQGMEKTHQLKLAKQKLIEERERNMSNEDREKRKKAGLLLAAIFGLTG